MNLQCVLIGEGTIREEHSSTVSLSIILTPLYARIRAGHPRACRHGRICVSYDKLKHPTNRQARWFHWFLDGLMSGARLALPAGFGNTAQTLLAGPAVRYTARCW
jgi:hypothetical protein